MSHPIDFIMRLRDMVSTPMRALQSNGVEAYRRMEAAAGRFQRRNDQLPQSINQIRDRLRELEKTREISISRRQIALVDREISQLETRLRSLDRKSSGGDGMSFLRQGMAMAGIAGGGALTGSIIRSGFEFEKNQVSFGTMLGSKDVGDKMLADIRNLDLAKVVGLDTALSSSKLLLSFGMEAEKILPTMRMLGDISGGNAEQMKSLSLAYAQMQSTGKLMGQDLLQMINAGFNPLNEISKITGISIGELKDMMANGAISAEVVEMAFRSATSEGGTFFNLLKNQSETLPGQWGAFTSKIKSGAVEMYEDMRPFLLSLLDFANFMVDNKELVGTMLLAWGAYALAVNAAAIKQWYLNAAMISNPIGIVLAAIVALAGLFYWAYQRVDWFRGGVLAAWGAIKETVKVYGSFIMDILMVVLKGFGHIGKAIIKLMKGDFKEAGKEALDGLKHLSGYNAYSNLYQNSKKIGEAAKNGYQKGLADLAKDTKETKAVFPDILSPEDTEKTKETGKAIMSAMSFIPEGMLPFMKNKPTTPTANGLSKEDFLAAIGVKNSGESSTGNSTSGLSDSVSGVTGHASKNINITVQKFFDNIVINTQEIKDGIDDMQSRVEEALLRVINSANIAG